MSPRAQEQHPDQRVEANLALDFRVLLMRDEGFGHHSYCQAGADAARDNRPPVLPGEQQQREEAQADQGEEGCGIPSHRFTKIRLASYPNYCIFAPAIVV